VLFHINDASFNFNWYVFNLADVAIVAGVIGLLFETSSARVPQKRLILATIAPGRRRIPPSFEGDSYAGPTSEELRRAAAAAAVALAMRWR